MTSHTSSSVSTPPRTLSALGRAEKLMEQRQYSSALKNYKSVLEQQKDTTIRKAHILHRVGLCLRQLDQVWKAIEHHQEALDIFQYNENTHGMLVSKLNLGMCYKDLGHYSTAFNLLNQVREYFLNQGKIEFKREQFTLLVPCLNSLGDVLICLGKPRQAKEKFLESGDAFSIVPEQQWKNLTWREFSTGIETVLGLAECLLKLGKYQIANNILQGSFGPLDNIGKTDLLIHIDNISGVRATYFYELGLFEKAKKKYALAIAAKRKIYGEVHSQVAELYAKMGNVCNALDESEEGLKWQKKALKILEKIFPGKHPSIAIVLSNMASCYSKLENGQQNTLKCYRRTLAIRQGFLGLNHSDTILSAYCVATSMGKDLVGQNPAEGLQPSALQMIFYYVKLYSRLETWKGIAVEKNPTGFFRLRLESPHKSFSMIRLNYWPKDKNQIKIVEAQHTHPCYFDSVILEGGYKHKVFEKQTYDEQSTMYRAYRIFKHNAMERNVYFLGRFTLKVLKGEEKNKGDIARFPRNLIHQVVSAQGGTLTMNCVFKDPTLAFYDIFTTGKIDPKVTRTTLSPEDATPILAIIKTLLQKCELKLNKQGTD